MIVEAIKLKWMRSAGHEARSVGIKYNVLVSGKLEWKEPLGRKIMLKMLKWLVKKRYGSIVSPLWLIVSPL
jgi:hypothetical protein